MKSDAKNLEELKNEIGKLKINENLEFESPTRIYIFEWMNIDYRDYGDGLKEYSWVAKYKYPHGVGYCFPMQNVNLINTFKTRTGCERNFINHIKFLFEKSFE